MILTAGLTPAWQQIMRFDQLRPGEVNRAVEVHTCASGKGLNVAIALSHLEQECTALAPLGGPALGLVEQEFAALGIARRWIEVARPTRVCTTILEQHDQRVTELVENAGSLDHASLDRFADAFSELAVTADVAVVTGSLPEGTQPTYYRDLIARARCRLILDIRGPELLELLADRPWLVKPNREELAKTVEADLSDDAILHQAMHALNRRGAEWVVVTTGAAPAWATSGGKLFRFDAAEVDVVNPIGSGDCLAAGIAAGMARGEAPLDAITLGFAAAADNVGRLLPARLDPKSVARRRELIAPAQV